MRDHWELDVKQSRTRVWNSFGGSWTVYTHSLTHSTCSQPPVDNLSLAPASNNIYMTFLQIISLLLFTQSSFYLCAFVVDNLFEKKIIISSSKVLFPLYSFCEYLCKARCDSRNLPAHCCCEPRDSFTVKVLKGHEMGSKCIIHQVYVTIFSKILW